MLRSTMDTEYTSVEMEYSQPADPARPPVLQLHVAHPRVLLLMRFVNDLLYAVEVVQVCASPRTLNTRHRHRCRCRVHAACRTVR